MRHRSISQLVTSSSTALPHSFSRNSGLVRIGTTPNLGARVELATKYGHIFNISCFDHTQRNNDHLQSTTHSFLFTTHSKGFEISKGHPYRGYPAESNIGLGSSYGQSYCLVFV